MARIYFVRHGKAAGGIADDPDPGLDDLGRTQAERAAATLVALPTMTIVSSPLRRAQETAVPLAARWEASVNIEPRVAEIPFDTTDLAERSAWLARVMPGRWSELGPDHQAWRDNLVRWATSQTHDLVVFSHFVAINVVVGAAQADDRMVVFRPDNGSITELETDGERLRVVTLGGEAATKVN